MSETKHSTPWTGNLSVDLRRGSLSVSAEGVALIDENDTCWAIVFPDKHGGYAHASDIVLATSLHHEMVSALDDLVKICERHIYPQPDKPNSAWAKFESARAVLAKAKPLNIDEPRG